MNFKQGDIILLNRHGKESNWFSNAQRFFTRMPYTHSALVLGKVKGLMSVLSADELVVVIPVNRYLEEEGTDIEVYRPKFVDWVLINQLMPDLYQKHAGKPYGYLQLLYFVFRWLAESFKIDVRKWKNPFTNNDICSELIFEYLLLTGSKPILFALSDYRLDNVHVGDIANICKNNPELFEKVM